MLTGDELSVVKPLAIAQQQLDIRSNQGLAVLVNPPVQFVFDFGKTVQHELPLPLRDVQRLMYFVGKKGEVLNAAAQRRAQNQVGVEEQRKALHRCVHDVFVNADDLPRRQEHEGAVLVVVGVPTVPNDALFPLLQCHRIEPKTDAVGIAPVLRDGSPWRNQSR